MPPRDHIRLLDALPMWQAMMDQLELGDLDDEARAAARTRRKAINAAAEGEILAQ